MTFITANQVAGIAAVATISGLFAASQAGKVTDPKTTGPQKWFLPVASAAGLGVIALAYRNVREPALQGVGALGAGLFGAMLIGSLLGSVLAAPPK